MKRRTIAGILLILSSCTTVIDNKKESGKITIESLDWLTGSWSNNSSEGQYNETWIKVNDTLFTGKSVMTKGNDTLFTEEIAIKESESGLYYIPVVSNQNYGLLILFKLVTNENSSFVFENKTHDFPQRIIYQKVQPDSLVAKIEGMQSGKYRVEYFRMKRD